MPYAEESLANYLSDTIRQVVRAEVLDPLQGAGKMYRQPRIFEDLLSSQPLCFNLFGELQQDLELASRTFATMLNEATVRVTSIRFEHSPGRGDPRFTGDHSAFDVFVTYQSREAHQAFVGIEVKYVENLNVPVARHRPRYEEIADAMSVFLPDARAQLREPPLEQFWRDHLLVGSLAGDRASGFKGGVFALVYPSGNTVVSSAVAAYEQCLSDGSTFAPWTLERLLGAIAGSGGGTWAQEVTSRYVVPAGNGA